MEIFVLFVICLAIYLAPTMVAAKRDHNNGLAIFVFNIFLGWTFLGWVIALVWACTSNVNEKESA